MYILALLAEIAFSTTLVEVLGILISIGTVAYGVWNIVSFLRSRASKQYVDEKLDEKLDKTEYTKHLELWEQYKARHEQAHTEISRATHAKIDKLQESFDEFSLKVIDILSKK